MTAFLRSANSRRTDSRNIDAKLLGAGLLIAIGSALWYERRRRAMNLHITELDGGRPAHAPPDSAEALRGGTPVQLLHRGAGPLYVRAYHVDIDHPALEPEALMQRIVEDINTYSPGELAQFEKTKGDPAHIAVGDEYFVHITGPWNGPVRVIQVTPTAFTFVTLEGHLEAGEISFSALEHPDLPDAIRFRIQSWARSSNRVTDLFYRTLGISRFAQTTMWSYFCQQVVETSGGEQIGGIEVMTHKVSAKALLQQMPAWKRYSRDFERWQAAQLNFDIGMTEQFTEAFGWRLDDYAIGLPSEAPGLPEPNGSFAAAKGVITNYEFPDPALISGIFVPDDPLNDRIMILRARFLFFTFFFGVRIANVIDKVRQTEKQGPASVWGYSYRTLEGHFEMGEITFEVWKVHETGEVRFRVHSYSRRARIRNPFYRLGFAIFGRSLQRRFARTATERMQQLVLERITPPSTEAEPVETPEVRPIAEDADAQDKLAEEEAKGTPAEAMSDAASLE
ncbi:MAG: DUF1990 family protein [Chloroflexi bacterium]|nr:DUF1990 family protein [Chloroflexota bacterium]